jgi:3-methyladenine DNA glycosylase AlkC
MTLPCGSYVARAGIDRPEVALPLLAELTPRWSSEGPIRPFLQRHPEITYEHLRRWVADPDEHVRRLVSEGTRPRLPWAHSSEGSSPTRAPTSSCWTRWSTTPPRTSAARSPITSTTSPKTIPISRSTWRQWLSRGDGAAWVVRHGLRTLVKRGDPRALELLVPHRTPPSGSPRSPPTAARCPSARPRPSASPWSSRGRRKRTRSSTTGSITLGANGVRRPKVFKLTRRRLVPSAPATVSGRHRFEHVSIHRIRPGRHTIDVQVNGHVLGAIDLDVVDPTTTAH